MILEFSNFENGFKSSYRFHDGVARVNASVWWRMRSRKVYNYILHG